MLKSSSHFPRLLKDPSAESALILLAMLSGLLALSLCVQPLVDDWIYMSSSGRTFVEFWSCAGQPVEGWSDALRSCFYHYLHSNGRLTDKCFIIFSTVLPGTIGRFLCVGSFGIGMLYMLLLAGGRTAMRSPGFVAITLCATFLFLPWEHYLISMACEFNYLLPCGFCIPILWWWLHSPRHLIRASAIAFIGGMMHESFGLSIMAGIGIMAIAARFRLSRSQWTIGLSFLCGLLVLMLAPGTAVRMSNAGTEQVNLPWVFHTLLTMPALMLSLAAAIIYATRFLITRRSEAEECRTLLLVATTAVASITTGLLALQRGRAYWFGDLMLICATMLMLRSLFPLLRRPMKLIGALLGVLLCGWLCWSAWLQHGYYREATELAEAIRLGRGTTPVWVDVSHEEEVSPWTLRIVHAPLPETFYNLKSQWYHFNPGRFDMSKEQGLPLPLPERLRGKHYTKWDSLPGGAGVYGSYPVFYVPSAAGTRGSEWASLTTFDISRAPLSPGNAWLKLRGVQSVEVPFASPVLRVPKERVAPTDTASFTDPRTGLVPDTLYFIYPQERPRRLHFAPISAMRL